MTKIGERKTLCIPLPNVGDVARFAEKHPVAATLVLGVPGALMAEQLAESLRREEYRDHRPPPVVLQPDPTGTGGVSPQSEGPTDCFPIRRTITP